ncbi:UNVERIFIED_CONTAM: Argininosuccinate lyase, chloroplastic [Sesamum calycinum]|uniref:Argininosuccinate lyase, chloroplastic n=1 Tax=Sesamum calycinum TaxID=2727403 RepID=A0AAW2NUU5_9LAMI
MIMKTLHKSKHALQVVNPRLLLLLSSSRPLQRPAAICFASPAANRALPLVAEQRHVHLPIRHLLGYKDASHTSPGSCSAVLSQVLVANPEQEILQLGSSPSLILGRRPADELQRGEALGGRFEESVTDAVEKFTESISFDKALYKHDIMGSRAHAAMLARQGLITDSDRDSILKGLDEIERQIERGEFAWRTDREDVHMNIEAALTDLVGEPAKKLHTARSRNDQVCTDFRLWCRDAIDAIVLRIKHLQVSLVKLALKNDGLIVPGYTHLQRAQPVLLQHLLLAYVEQLERDASRLLDCRVRMNFCPLGACALAGTGLPIDRFMTSEALGFTAPMRNSVLTFPYQNLGVVFFTPFHKPFAKHNDNPPGSPGN